MNVKPGWRTSEFWTTLVSQALGLLTAVGLVTSQDAGTLQGALGQCVAAVFLLLANGWVVVRYIQARVTVKTGGVSPPAGGGDWPNVLPLFLAALVLFASASPARAQVLPWRRQVEQRLKNLEAQQRQSPAPAPAPQIIVVPAPLQQLPIAGEPKQVLPIQGDPRQQLPIQGAPKQQLPIPGNPQQQLPIQGLPQQQLPIQGPVPQQLPQQMPPAAGLGIYPQPYTVIRALYRRAS